MRDAGGHEFGFELTFFREALTREAQKASDWSAPDAFVAHLALSDISGGKFYHRERLNRAGPGIAGVNAETGRIWNGNWQIEWKGNAQNLRAISDQFALQLTLESQKPPVIHGIDGISQKSAGAGHASHYISLTRLTANGDIDLGGKKFAVTGTAWMDHEFFTQQLGGGQIGWDWFSLQLDDHTELMLFRLRLKDGSIDPFSSGTYIDAAGKTTHLAQKDFSLQPARRDLEKRFNSRRVPDSLASYRTVAEIDRRRRHSAAAAGTRGKYRAGRQTIGRARFAWPARETRAPIAGVGLSGNDRL